MKRRALETTAPLDLFDARPFVVTPSPEAVRVPASPRAVYAPILPGAASSTVQREPLDQRWHDMAAECPAHRSAAAHCWPVDGKGWAHLVEGDGAPRCVPAVQVLGEMRPVAGLQGWERTTDAQRLAELGGRY